MAYTALTGTGVQTTYVGLLKLDDNLPVSGTLKDVSTGTGGATALSLSTTAAKVTGTFQATGAATVAGLTSSGAIAYSGATNSGVSVSDGTVTGIAYASASSSMAVGTQSNHPLNFLVNNSIVGGFTSRGINTVTNTPSSASDTGATGTICWDANYIYVCTATNTWKRSAIATW